MTGFKSMLRRSGVEKVKVYRHVVVLPVLVCVYYLLSFEVQPTPVNVLLPEQSPLAVYGARVYQRENCSVCHTLNSSNQTDKIISLDGFGGTRSYEWMMSFFSDPKAIVAGATMPAYRHLFSSSLDKRFFSEALGNKEKVDVLFEKLEEQSDSISHLFSSPFHSFQQRTEVIALLAFLNQIPSSKFKQAQDSVQYVRDRAIYQQVEEQYKGQDTLIVGYASNSKYVAEGKEIYSQNCSLCHGINASGDIGPSLTDANRIYGNNTADLVNVILYGTSKGMPSYKHLLAPHEIGKLAAYLRAIDGTDRKASPGKNENK